MKTLILIDFQEFYCEQANHKRKELIENVVKISRVFMANNWPIIIVYFEGAYDRKDLIKEMEDILEYKRSVLVKKTRCDGSEQILDQIDLHEWPLNVVVCGVYGNECVQETVNGLAERDRKIQISVLEDCIWPNSLSIETDYENRIDIYNNQNDLMLV